ncbi:hypothetical protein T484DRAFT_1805563, partial [Baffinella frigidus]
DGAANKNAGGERDRALVVRQDRRLFQYRRVVLSDQQARTVFRILDSNNDGRVREHEFMGGCRRNPDLAMMLGLPTPEHQESGYQRLVAHREIEVRHEFDLEDWVAYFCKQPPAATPALQIQDRRWTHSEDVMGAPSLYEGRMLADGPLAVPRGWAQRMTSRKLVPKITKLEALRFFEEIGLRKGESISHEELTWHLRRQPALAARLGQKRIHAEELAAFFSDMGLSDPYAIEEMVEAPPSVSMKEAFRVYQALCASLPPGGQLTHLAVMKGLEMSTELASTLNLLGALKRPRREERSRRVFEALFGVESEPHDERKISMREFVLAFSRADLGSMGLAIPYQPHQRP